MGNGQEPPNLKDLKPRITVIGVGGAGCNAVNNMIAAGLQGVEFVVANTDAQSLVASSAEHRIQLGAHLTEGLGAGSKPEIGHAAAEETLTEIEGYLYGSHMVFIAAGMGGGTGTGAAGVIARVARDLGALTVAIVTKPFQFEGSRRMRLADAGINELKKYVDTLIVIPNQNLFRIANERTTFAEAFVLADQVLYSGVACIVDLVLKEGLINLDFADVRTVMTDMGSAMMGTGEASGDRRAIIAAEEAIANPLLDDVSLKGARGLLLSITGGRDLTLYEVDEAANRVRQEIDPEANVILGATFDDNLGDRVRVSIVASGMMRSAHGAGHVPQAHQAPPPQAAPPFPGTPASHPRGWDEDQMNKRLSDAIKAGAVPPPPPRTLQQRPFGELQATGKTEWRAPGNVLIEELVGGSAPASRVDDYYRAAAKGNQTSDFALPPTVQAGIQPNSQHSGHYSGGFEPARPQDIRRMQPIMPIIEDFPPTAQREWRSKNSAAAAGPGNRKGSGAPAEPAKRPSLFERLSKMRKREEQNADTSDDQTTHHTRFAPDGTARPPLSK